ncbi:MAG: aminotransferase class V-fold PLP-dependent enzyme [Flavobacterium sp.]|nr:aminotransferase class V-fold PLP-dependent enzyme [Flavobacterium sp.]
MKDHFLLSPDITFLNHGSFGACPKPVFDAYQDWQLQLERNPVQFIVNDGPKYLLESKRCLAEYINCLPTDFYFTQNPTAAVNTIMRSLHLSAGDEILATNHEYGAMDRTWDFYCRQSGAKYVRQPISLPVKSAEKVIEEFWQGYTSRTKVVFINHMSSVTAMFFPVKEIIIRAKELGLITIIDGAHIPGHIPLDLSDLDPDYYTGALHKWLLTPKGSSFLYVRKELQSQLDPLIVSWGFGNPGPSDNQFLEYHEQQGTRDFSAYLTIPTAIDFMNRNLWNERTSICRQIVKDNYQLFCNLLDTEPLCPITNDFLGQMASIPIRSADPLKLKDVLYRHYKIEIPVMTLNDRVYLRYSINVYNSQTDLDILYDALKNIIKSGVISL